MTFIEKLNRVIIVVLCLVLIVLLSLVFVFPHITLTILGDWFMGWGRYFRSAVPWLRVAVGIVLALVTDLILALLIILEIRPQRGRYLRVQQIAGGLAHVNIDSVIKLLQHRLAPLPDVAKVTPHVWAKGRKVAVRVDVGVGPEANIPNAAAEMIEVIQRTLTEELGLEIAGQPELRVTVVSQKGKIPAPKVETQPQPPALPPEIPPAIPEEKPAGEESNNA